MLPPAARLVVETLTGLSDKIRALGERRFRSLPEAASSGLHRLLPNRQTNIIRKDPRRNDLIFNTFLPGVS